MPNPMYAIKAVNRSQVPGGRKENSAVTSAWLRPMMPRRAKPPTTIVEVEGKSDALKTLQYLVCLRSIYASTSSHASFFAVTRRVSSILSNRGPNWQIRSSARSHHVSSWVIFFVLNAQDLLRGQHFGHWLRRAPGSAHLAQEVEARPGGGGS